MAKEKYLLLFLGLILLFCYSNTFFNGFVWDDKYIVVHNDFIKNFSSLGKIFTTDLFSDASEKFNLRHSNFYRPLQSITYLADFCIWKYNPFGYHLTNIALHYIAAVLVFFLLVLLGQNLRVAFLVSLIFGIHPAATESVSYISGRAEILAAIFILISLNLYIKFKESSEQKFYFFSIVSFLLAVISKEMSIALPALLILYDYYYKNPSEKSNFLILKKEYIPYFFIAISYIILRITTLNFAPSFDIFEGKALLSERLLAVPGIIVKYLEIFFLPFNLHMQYEIVKVRSFLSADFIIPLISLILVIVFIWRILKADKVSKFFIMWFFITLLPQLNIFPINASIAEHWLYLPGIGLIAYIVHIGSGFYDRAGTFLKRLIMGVFILICFTMAGLIVLRNMDWHSDESIYRATLKYALNDPKIYFNLARSLDEKGDKEGAILNYKKAIELNPKFSEALVNAGILYIGEGKFDIAAKSLNLAIKYNPKDFFAHNALGRAYEAMGDFEKSAKAYRSAIMENESFFEARDNLAKLLLKSDKFSEALEEFKYIADKTNNSNAYYNLGYAYYSLKDLKNAETSWKKALLIDPSNEFAVKGLKDLKK